jgi:5-methylcytosine-specific restriction endonuclease McrA
VTKSHGKRSRLRLDCESFRRLCRRVLKRDGWQCQSCGCLAQLQVHHIRLRSQLGADAAQNLITVCADCHKAIHLKALSEPT